MRWGATWRLWQGRKGESGLGGRHRWVARQADNSGIPDRYLFPAGGQTAASPLLELANASVCATSGSNGG